ncbi:hypothetical protein [Nonomuraea sp. NPDC048826]|uniref:hypothetical protein n=1 Tax=Nonomuraea sp. NPDC048826 TaxID=3364347 RepID=UPI0037153A5D
MKIAKVGGHVHTGTEVPYRRESVTLRDLRARTPDSGRTAASRGGRFGGQPQVHRITKFTYKESEFVRYRIELNEKLGMN